MAMSVFTINTLPPLLLKPETMSAAPPAVGSEASRAPGMWPRYDTRPIDRGDKWRGRNPVENEVKGAEIYIIWEFVPPQFWDLFSAFLRFAKI